jgi:ATP-dependent Clp protease protease subunit
MGKRFWSIKAAADKTGEIYIYGDIVSDKWYDTDITAASFNEDLKVLGDVETLNIYINSYGGSVFQGQAIYSILKRHPAPKNVYIDGIAASIASLIAMAGDTVFMPQNAIMMVHNPWSFAIGNAQELRKEADALDRIREAMIPAYMAKLEGKTDEATLRELMDAETWLTAADAFSYGFVDEITAAQAAAASASPDIIERYKNMPEAARALLKDAKSEEPGPSQKGLAPKDLHRRRLLSEAAVIRTMLDPSK